MIYEEQLRFAARQPKAAEPPCVPKAQVVWFPVRPRSERVPSHAVKLIRVVEHRTRVDETFFSTLEDDPHARRRKERGCSGRSSQASGNALDRGEGLRAHRQKDDARSSVPRELAGRRTAREARHRK